jgi:hypothetical protein
MDTNNDQSINAESKTEDDLSGGNPDLGAPGMRQKHCLKADDCTINITTNITNEDNNK